MPRFSLIALLLLSLAPRARADLPVDFDKQIKPLLSDRCFVCHGPDAKKREADLRLDQEDSAKDYLVEGEPDESEIFARITSDDPDERMPPADSKLSLSDDEIALIKRWIEEGAAWEKHWAFRAAAVVDLPKVDNQAWCRNPIDRFVLRRIEAAGLTPAEEAGRERLLRRITFDLTGLPPTLEELDAFLADQSPRAYEKVVDRLLESERYGERMAAMWLDAARYSDTYGYQVDRDRFVWPWRDWVIRSFNANLPYDRFLTEQLAGDLLPDATDDQILATTFNRLHPQKVEGGSTPEEFRVEYVLDRTQTIATAFLGLTMECCRCHDHKYDPLSQKEYYQLTAFMDNIDEAGLYSYFTPAVPTPTLLMTDEATKGRLAELAAAVEAAEKQLAETNDEQRAAFQRWRQSAEKLEVPGRVAHLDFEKQGDGANRGVPGRVGKAVQLSGDDGIGLKVGNFRRFDPFSVALWMNTPDVKQRAVVFHRSRAWTDAGSRGYQLLLEDGRLSFSLIHFWPGNALRVRTADPLPTKQWQHVTVTYDGSSRADGVRIHVNGKLAKTEVVRDNLYKNITGGGGDNITIGERFRDRGFANGLVDEFQVFDRELSEIEAVHLHDGETLKLALQTASAKGGDEANQQPLLEYYLAAVDPQQAERRGALRKRREQHCTKMDGIREIMTMRELPQPRTTYFLNRGAYDARGEAVEPGTPAAFPPFPSDAPRNRLGLAKWLTTPEHPLTSRVGVNRFWQLMFGAGLVRSPEDFGRQGQPPTHPDLLDWLARDFDAHQWDIKRLLKQIALSATYRQSSSGSAAAAKRDPENRLLARGPSYRLPAEMLRDNALAVSGLLVNRIGGAPAKPYEVEVSFKPAKRDKGEGLYRRSVYTYWKRTGPAPVMMTLDAAKRDVCRVRRERTSTPLQVLVLMNGPQFVEASRMLAQRLLRQHGENSEALLGDMFRLLTSRRPSDRHRQVLQQLHADQLAYFGEDAARAEAFLKIGDAAVDAKLDKVRLAAAAAVANALFSYDEAVSKR